MYEFVLHSGHHKNKEEKERLEAREREEALARSMPPVTPPRYGGMGTRPGFMPQRSPRYPSPQHGLHPVALSRALRGGRMRSPGPRHQPYPLMRPQRPSLSYDQQGRSPGQQCRSPGQGPGSSPSTVNVKPIGNKLDGQVIKIEPEDDDEKSNQSASDSIVQTNTDSNVQESSPPPSPSLKPSTPSQSQGQSASDNDDAKSESSTSTIPNETADIKFSDTAPPGGLSLDSDLSNIISSAAGSVTDSNIQQPVTPQGSGSEPGTPVDPNVSVKLEALTESEEMDLEITGVELGQRPVPDPMVEPMGSQDWMASVQNVMQGGATGSPADMTSQQGYSKCRIYFQLYLTIIQ